MRSPDYPNLRSVLSLLISGKVFSLTLPCCSDYARMVRNGWVPPPAVRYRPVSRESCAAVWTGAVFCLSGAGSKFPALRRTTAAFLLLLCRRRTHSPALRLWAGCHGDRPFRHSGKFLFFAALFFFHLWPWWPFAGISLLHGFVVDHQRCLAEVGGGNGGVQEPEPVGGNPQDHHGGLYLLWS
jgi:hypothetical protein